MQDRITCERLTVLPDRVEALVRVNDERAMRTTPTLIARILSDHPTLPVHSCRNDQGPTFAAVMDNTSIPHVIEHLVIDIQTREMARRASSQQHYDQAVFTGTTQWSEDDPHLAIVRVSFLDDLVALAAFKTALHFMNQVLDDVLESDAPTSPDRMSDRP